VLPRWREAPSYLLNIIRSTIETSDIGKIKAQQKEKADKAWREVTQRVPFYKRGLIKNLIKQAIKSAELSEMSKSVLVKTVEPKTSRAKVKRVVESDMIIIDDLMFLAI
jgi:pyruvate,water dikinase